MELIYMNDEHKAFCEKMKEKTKRNIKLYEEGRKRGVYWMEEDDPYLKNISLRLDLFFYLVGLSDKLRKHIYELYDFNQVSAAEAEYCPLSEPKVIDADWMEEKDKPLIRLAFNIYYGTTFEPFIPGGSVVDEGIVKIELVEEIRQSSTISIFTETDPVYVPYMMRAILAKLEDN
jgi:hypothetical protein